MASSAHAYTGGVATRRFLFLHLVSHSSTSYRFSTEDRADWIAKHFFTGGIMPSHQLIRQFPDVFRQDAEWRWAGTHDQKTAHAWLENYDRNRSAISSMLREVYGKYARL